MFVELGLILMEETMHFRILIAVNLMILALAGASGCWKEDCDLVTTAAELAGEGAVDCGSVEAGADATAAWACAVEAFEAGQPFSIVVANVGVDSVILHAVVSNGVKTWTLAQDQYQKGPWRIDGMDCLEPYVGTQPDDAYDVDDVSGYEIVACTSTAPEGNRYEVCGSCPGCGEPALPFEP